MSIGKDECPWCGFNPGCPGEGCDFKDLTMEKEAIIGRMTEEKKEVTEILKKISEEKESDELLREVQDRMAGMQIMGRVLEEKFGVGKDELSKILGGRGGKLNFLQKAKLLMRIQELQKRRRAR